MSSTCQTIHYDASQYPQYQSRNGKGRVVCCFVRSRLLASVLLRVPPLKFPCLPISLPPMLLPFSSPSLRCSLLPPLASSLPSFLRSVHPFLTRSLPQPSLPSSTPAPTLPHIIASSRHLVPPSLPPSLPLYLPPSLPPPPSLPLHLSISIPPPLPPSPSHHPSFLAPSVPPYLPVCLPPPYNSMYTACGIWPAAALSLLCRRV